MSAAPADGRLDDDVVRIGGIALRNRVLLAPMAGLTDAPMRRLAWQFGAGYTVGEMVASREDLWPTAKSSARRQQLADSGPTVVQIAGSDPAAMADIARRHADDGAEVIDINFGCPAKKVCRRAAGSALLAQPALIGAIVEAVAAAVPVPVTAKMRTGTDPGNRNGVAVARIAEAAGAQALTVHGRTRACRFKGAVEYDTVRAIKAAVSVPVFANGDISSRCQAQAVLRYTGADGVMIGRAAVGRPWLLGEIAGAPATPREARWQSALAQVRGSLELYGSKGSRVVRKHIERYLLHLGHGSSVGEFNRLETGEAQLCWLGRLMQDDLERDENDHETSAGACQRIRQDGH